MDKIKKLQSKSLSDSEILKLVNNKANLLTYPELLEYEKIEDALGPNKCLILLYLTKENYGHWVCLIDHGNRIEFFDSYNYKPDHEQDFIPKKFKKESHQEIPYLTKLLLDSGKPIEYNHAQLQGNGKGINTCGRHVGVRIKNRNIKLDDYIKILQKGIKKGLSPDIVVTYLSRNI
jgi:hypothetical protein